MLAEVMLLRDSEIVPTKEVLQKVLGSSLFSVFEELEKFISGEEFGLSYSWNYYKDGKSWLCKVVKGKKTVFWLSAWDGFLKTSFFFTEKTRHGVYELQVSEEVKQKFSQAKTVGKLFPLIFDIDNKDQLKELSEIVKYKKSIK